MNPSQFQEIQAYPHVRNQCANSLDLYVADIRSIMQLPFGLVNEMQPNQPVVLADMTGGCNFLSCTAMLDIVAGLSVCLYFLNSQIGFDTRNDRGHRFEKFFASYYPWQYESLPKSDVTRLLWAYLRNPLVHSLGVLPFSPATIGQVAVDRIYINKNALDFREVMALEGTDRPSSLSSTFELDRAAFIVNIPCLYWSLHQMFHNLFSDAIQMRLVDSWYANRMGPPQPDETRL